MCFQKILFEYLGLIIMYKDSSHWDKVGQYFLSYLFFFYFGEVPGWRGAETTLIGGPDCSCQMARGL